MCRPSCTPEGSWRRWGIPANTSRASPGVFFLEVDRLCCEEAESSLRSFARWLALFFDQVSLRDPVIDVLDMEKNGMSAEGSCCLYRKRTGGVLSGNFWHLAPVVGMVLMGV